VFVWHLGPLHPIEQGLTIALAIGPFVILAIVIKLGRRRDQEVDPASGQGPDAEQASTTTTAEESAERGATPNGAGARAGTDPLNEPDMP